nr:hypothetical protein GCM10020092_074370 [Actinoplanes digitatis]
MSTASDAIPTSAIRIRRDLSFPVRRAFGAGGTARRRFRFGLGRGGRLPLDRGVPVVLDIEGEQIQPHVDSVVRRPEPSEPRIRGRFVTQGGNQALKRAFKFNTLG